MIYVSFTHQNKCGFSIAEIRDVLRASKGWIAHVREEGHLRDEHQLLMNLPKQATDSHEYVILQKPWQNKSGWWYTWYTYPSEKYESQLG